MTDLLSRAISVYREEGARIFGRKAMSFAYNRRPRPMQSVYNQYWNVRYGSGTSILEKDWDNLLLLDAARYDEFVRVAPFDQKSIDRRITLGSRTPEFLPRTFNNAELHDTVYITANPQPLRYQFESDTVVFHDMISLLDEWDPETQTIRPEIVREAAIEASEAYPNKRLLIHFLQPHAPFLGPTAAEIRRRTGKTLDGLNPGREYTGVESKEIDTGSYGDILNEGVDREEIRMAYRETLGLVIEECQQLANSLYGKTALTSDHGELLGERVHPFGPRRWEHPGDVRTAELCVVPWIEFDNESRKRVTAEPPKDHEPASEEVVDRRLRSLGYK